MNTLTFIIFRLLLLPFIQAKMRYFHERYKFINIINNGLAPSKWWSKYSCRKKKTDSDKSPKISHNLKSMLELNFIRIANSPLYLSHHQSNARELSACAVVACVCVCMFCVPQKVPQLDSKRIYKLIAKWNPYPYKLINYLHKIDCVRVNHLCMWTHIKSVENCAGLQSLNKCCAYSWRMLLCIFYTFIYYNRCIKMRPRAPAHTHTHTEYSIYSLWNMCI